MNIVFQDRELQYRALNDIEPGTIVYNKNGRVYLVVTDESDDLYLADLEDGFIESKRPNDLFLPCHATLEVSLIRD